MTHTSTREAFIINHKHKQWGGLHKTDRGAAIALAAHLGVDMQTLQMSRGVSAAGASDVFRRIYHLYRENGHRRPIDLEHALGNLDQSSSPAMPTKAMVWLVCRVSVYRTEWQKCAAGLSGRPTGKELGDALRKTAARITHRLRVDTKAAQRAEVPLQEKHYDEKHYDDSTR